MLRMKATSFAVEMAGVGVGERAGLTERGGKLGEAIWGGAMAEMLMGFVQVLDTGLSVGSVDV